MKRLVRFMCIAGNFSLMMRLKRIVYLLLGMIAVVAIHAPAAYAGVAVVCNASSTVAGKLDKQSLARIFTGRTVQIDGVTVIPVNLPVGNAERGIFLRHILQQNDDEYVAYWLVRKSIGKGIPPQELPSSQDVLRFIRSNTGAIGYIKEQDVAPDVRLLLTIQ